MANCYNCGAEFSGNFCPACGASAQAPAPVQPVMGPVNQVPPPSMNTQPIYNNISVVTPNTTTSALGWFGWLLLCSVLPLIGVIIMMMTTNDPSAKNFAKLQLILWAIGAGIGILMFLLVVVLGVAASSSY